MDRGYWTVRICIAVEQLLREQPSLLDREVDERCLSARLARLLAPMVESPGFPLFVDAEFNKAIGADGEDGGKDGPLGKRPDVLVHNRMGADNGDWTELYIEVKWSHALPLNELKEIYQQRAIDHNYQHTCILDLSRAPRRARIQWLQADRDAWEPKQLLVQV